MTVAEQHDWLSSFLRRHPVSRRSALRGGAGVLAATGLAAAPWTLTACATAAQTPVAVVGRHLAYGADAQRQMAFAGELTAPPAGPVVVDLGRDGGFGTTLPVDVRRLVSRVPQDDGAIRGSEQFFVHALADGLAPGERYRYRFRLPDGTTTPEAEFVTAPGPGATAPWSFTAFADQGVDTVPPSGQEGFTNDYDSDDTRRTMTPSTSMVDRIARQRPAFHLLAGDICYADPSGEGLPERRTGSGGFDSFDPTVWTTYFGLIERSAASTPWMFATGNHDMEALYDDNRAGGASHGYGGHAARLDLPRTGPSACPSVYTFRHGTVGVISLDANDLSTEIPTNAGYSGGAQTSWLRQTLAAMRADAASTGSSRSSTTAPSRRRSRTPPTPGCAPRWRRCSTSSRSTSSCRATTTSTSARTRSGAGARSCRPPTARPCARRPTARPTCASGSGGRPRYSWLDGVTDRYRGNPGPDSGVDRGQLPGARRGREAARRGRLVAGALPGLRLRHRRRRPAPGRRRGDDPDRPRDHRHRHRDRPRRPVPPYVSEVPGYRPEFAHVARSVEPRVKRA